MTWKFFIIYFFYASKGVKNSKWLRRSFPKEPFLKIVLKPKSHLYTYIRNPFLFEISNSHPVSSIKKIVVKHVIKWRKVTYNVRWNSRSVKVSYTLEILQFSLFLRILWIFKLLSLLARNKICKDKEIMNFPYRLQRFLCSCSKISWL